MKNKLMYDIEIYPNYMLVGFIDLNGNVQQFEAFGESSSLGGRIIRKIWNIINNNTLVGFNSKAYDDPILTLMLKNKNTKTMFEYSKMIIEGQFKHWEVYDKLNIKPEFNSIDLIDVAPGQASLKLYGARLSSKKLQDLPYDPYIAINKEQAIEVADYNINDLRLTTDLYNKLIPHLSLRESIGKKYGIDVMSKSDAQIAEAIFRYELTDKGIKIQRASAGSIRYKAPSVIKFKRDDLNELVKKIERTTIELSDNGQPILPDWLKDVTINIGTSTYNIGLGGLHSQEKSIVIRPDKDEILSNVDVASYYPSLIIDLQLYPKQLTKTFLRVYAEIKAKRLQAKKDKNDLSLTEDQRHDAKIIDDVLKIALNGSYGKFGNKYSFLYSPDLLLTVTFTGQLYLLMLIEDLEYRGLKVVSSNTDGLEVLYHKDKKRLLQRKISNWENKTGMVMEYGEYSALFSRDVNNYIAVYPGGKTKAKGVYIDPEERTPILEKNVEYPIVFEAIREYLSKDIAMEDTLYACKDIARFTSSRSVKGGAIYYDGILENTKEYDEHLIKNGYLKVKAIGKRNDDYQKKLILDSNDTKYLGKVVRWYYSINGKPIFYKTGNKVPKSDGARPMMDLTEHIPKDLDYDKYLQLCQEHLTDLGV